MIADTERLIDGFRGLPAGMDGSKEPPQTPSEAAWYATNVTFRGGNGPRTRPGFREIPPNYWRNPQPTRVSNLAYGDGTVVRVKTTVDHGYEDSDFVTMSGAVTTGFNGSYRITKTANDEFIFNSTAQATATRTSSSIVGNGTTATVITTAAHGYSTGHVVVLVGAEDVGFNGVHTITVVNTTTFTFPSTVNATATTQGTIYRATSISSISRDVDATYSDDLINSTTSRTRYLNDIVAATFIQGVFVYQDPRQGNPAQMIVVADGKIMALDFGEASVRRLNLSDEISPDVPVYMTQAEKFLIIQTGQDEPRIYDGYVLRRASWYGDQVVPIGKQMAYGQGRLFVAVNEGAEIVAGDLVFGGSTTNVGITSSTAANPTVVTTDANHGFSNGDLVTISGHSSSPLINSTYAVSSVAATTFTVPVAVTAAGRGGFAARFNAGQDSDLLRFTENTYLNEGGAFAPTGKVGRVTGLAFLPVQDTSTGQGDLIAFCERGAVTFQVSAPRDQWKNTQGFQRVLFDNIGSTSDSIIPVNGDLFFRSREGNGIRTYRNARAESDGYGQTPLSAEIDPVLNQDTQWMLDQVSFAYFDNRLLMTCLPKRFPRRATDQAQADQFALQPVPTLYEGIAVLDFQSSSSGRGKSAAVFDGVWTGLRVIKLVQGTFGGDPRCFALCFHQDDTGRRVELWEITKDDEFDTPVEGPRRVNSGIVTKAYDFEEAMSLKKLIRCDLWFDDLGGGLDYPFECELAYRPDDYPNFTTWQRFDRAFQTEFLLTDKNLLGGTHSFDGTSWTRTRTIVNPNVIANPLNLAVDADKVIGASGTNNTRFVWRSVSLLANETYTLSVYAKAAELNRIYLRFNTAGVWGAVLSAWFHLSGYGGSFSNVSAGVSAAIEAVGDGWYRCSMTATTTGAGNSQHNIALANVAGGSNLVGDGVSGVFLYGAQLELGPTATAYDPDPPELPNLERGYTPQVRFPVPPLTANIATGVPAYLGHDFTLRVNWTGRAHLGRLMLHGNRLTEAVNGGSL